MNDLQRNETNEDKLRSEIEDLRRQLEEQKRPKGPSAFTAVVVVLLLALLAGAGYFFGYLPKVTREAALAAESETQSGAQPVVNVSVVARSEGGASLVLPGNIQAVTEAPVLARASGYIKKRYVDIGDRVKEGQVLADIEAPEMQQEIQQAQAALTQSKATIDQANAAMQQSQASLQQGQTNENLAHVTYDRFKKLADRGVISKQDIDTYQAQWTSQQANVQALEKAVVAAHSNAAAAEANSAASQANLARLTELDNYLTVRAPFAGIITVRNVDTGALVNSGSTLLFRIAQPDRLRIYLSLPQGEADAVRAGQKATLTIPDLPGRKFVGSVARTANSLDPQTRTLLTEVQLSNPTGELLPGMYAQVDLAVPRKNPPLVIASDTLVVRSNGPQVAVVGADETVHYQPVQLGRDFGDKLEVLGGLEAGQRLVVNPSDAIREGIKVKPTGGKEKS
jgi:multidrug efflux pump subunit AcrA (membrane-fusion protein)